MPKAKAKPHRLVVVQNDHLTNWATSDKFLKEFPFLRQLQTALKARGRGCCGQKDKNRADALNKAKTNVAGLSSDKKRILKRLLNADKVRISYMRGRQKVNLTF
jgi:hypothetical protein